MNDPLGDLVTTRQAMPILKVTHASTISRYVGYGRLAPVTKLAGRTGAYLFRRADVERLANELASTRRPGQVTS